MEQYPTLSEQQQLANDLADLVETLRVVAKSLPGGFDHAKTVVKNKYDHGMPLPTAIYETLKEIIEDKHGKT